jgi:predicted SAM-dependent methyltransferase
MKLNLGSGGYRAGPRDQGWIDVDEDPAAGADWRVHVPPIDLDHDTVDEIYAGHLLEHFAPDEAHALLRECYRVLIPGGRLGVVVPDTREILRRYLDGRHTWVEVPQGQHWNLDDLDSVCAVFLYSTIQRSRHQWSYDAATLRRALERAGFVVTGAIHPEDDPRISVGAFYNLGLDARKPVGGPVGGEAGCAS